MGGVELLWDGGVCTPVGRSGLLIGRAPTSDVVLQSPSASGLHAVVCLAPEGVELHGLGRNPVSVGGVDVRGRRVCHVGERIDFPGVSALVQACVRNAPERWFVQRDEAPAHQVRAGGWQLGGGAGSDLAVQGWPAVSAVLHLADDALYVEFMAPGSLDGAHHEVGAMVAAPAQGKLSFAGDSVWLRNGEAGGLATTHHAQVPGVSDAVLELHPTGATLRLVLAAEQYAVGLSELRSRLVAVLLQPPSGHMPGDFVSDDVLIPRVWPRSVRTHLDVNTLVHRVRSSMIRAGVDAAQVLERAPQGRATRFVLQAGAHAEVR
jgi:hypothetical protein